ncbi:MAG: saccharopine dehydrogenase NADP-binding domain-containing protein, partial [Betaproteobacteria bacterium]|nr:saccharopine dehydrogenase NADP-binding domain-containing protein [Betaproteobacteria bacterium]
DGYSDKFEADRSTVGFDGRYEAVDVEPEALGAWVEKVRRAETLGFNVTIPHKETITRHLDRVEGDGQLTGAVNAVIVESDARGQVHLTGTNTDTLGFRRLLSEEEGCSLEDQRVLLLGAGGAARAVALVALQDGARELWVVNRHVERADRLIADLQQVRQGTATEAVAWHENRLEALLGSATVVINATPIGLASTEMPVDPSPVQASALVVDLIYNPLKTALLRAAAERGLTVLGGLGMLVHQAAAAFERWTEAEAPIGVMRSAAEAALKERTQR